MLLGEDTKKLVDVLLQLGYEKAIAFVDVGIESLALS